MFDHLAHGLLRFVVFKIEGIDRDQVKLCPFELADRDPQVLAAKLLFAPALFGRRTKTFNSEEGSLRHDCKLVR